jgi:hypothetical protein
MSIGARDQDVGVVNVRIGYEYVAYSFSSIELMASRYDELKKLL